MPQASEAQESPGVALQVRERLPWRSPRSARSSGKACYRLRGGLGQISPAVVRPPTTSLKRFCSRRSL